MKFYSLRVAVAFFVVFSTVNKAAPKPEMHPTTIENGQIRIGVDMASGGGICYFSLVSPERNLVNHFDKGRLIQQSYYGEKDGSTWTGKPWRWNPVQGGGFKGQPGVILASTIGTDSMDVQTQPRHWATGDAVTDVVMEEHIDLNGKVAHIHFKFTNKGDHDRPVTDQEVPAFFADYALPNLVYYQGPSPWTDAPVSRKVPGWPNQSVKTDESWAAYVDDKDWGIGLYFPGSTRVTSYRYAANHTTGPMGASCSYFAPIQKFAITRDFVHEYDLYLTIGTATEMRAAFKAIHDQARP